MNDIPETVLVFLDILGIIILAMLIFFILAYRKLSGDPSKASGQPSTTFSSILFWRDPGARRPDHRNPMSPEPPLPVWASRAHMEDLMRSSPQSPDLMPHVLRSPAARPGTVPSQARPAVQAAPAPAEKPAPVQPVKTPAAATLTGPAAQPAAAPAPSVPAQPVAQPREVPPPAGPPVLQPQPGLPPAGPASARPAAAGMAASTQGQEIPAPGEPAAAAQPDPVIAARPTVAGPSAPPAEVTDTAPVDDPRRWRPETLAAEIRAGFNRIVSQTRSFQEQIQLLHDLKKTIDRSHPIDEEKAEKFNENSKSIDQLSEIYTGFYRELYELMERENGTYAPEILHDLQMKESERIEQMTELSKRIQPLLNENEDIIAPFIQFSK